MNVLVTGATGYIGGRLIPRLLDAGHTVRILARDPARVAGRDWSDRVEVHGGDLLEPESLEGMGEGIDVAYYLVHSMTSQGDFEEKDREAAENFVAAVRNVSHVIYLGGLMPPEGEEVSKHLRSRAEVGRVLREALPTTEFRAGPIIGSGSASYELVRHLTERLPVMITPRWVRNAVQPIAVRDILAYLIAAIDRGPLGVVEVGADPLSFREMMLQYAAERELTRRILTVPILTPRLTSYWAMMVTPIPGHLARALIEGMVTSLLADRTRAREHFPEIEEMPYARAVRLAIEKVETGEIETRWSGSTWGGDEYEFEEDDGLYRSTHQISVSASQDLVYRSFSAIGGENGWYVWNSLWRVRGTLDKVVGGPGLRRGRRHPVELLPGEALDFWRVEEVRPPELLRLRAEMRVPGRAWLQWETREREGGQECDLKQSAIYAPKGLWGRVYWWASYPFHLFIFRDMIEEIRTRAEKERGEGSERESERSRSHRPSGAETGSGVSR